MTILGGRRRDGLGLRGQEGHYDDRQDRRGAQDLRVLRGEQGLD